MTNCDICSSPNKENLLAMNDEKSKVIHVCGRCFYDMDDELKLRIMHNAVSSILFMVRLIINAICVSSGIYKTMDYFGIDIREDYQALRRTGG